MAIRTTHLFTISFEHVDLINVLQKIEYLKEKVYPQDSKKIASNVKGVSVMDGGNPYNEIVETAASIMECLGITNEEKECQIVDANLEKEQTFLETIRTKMDTIVNVEQEIQREKEENEDALRLLQQIDDANLNIDEIQECQYITCRFGKIGIEQKEKIKYYREYPFIFKELRRSSTYIWCLYVGLTKNINEIDNVFHAMSFEEITLPSFIHGRLDEAIQEIQEETRAMQRYSKQMNERLVELKNNSQEELIATFSKVSNLQRVYDHCRYVVDFSQKAAIYAFSTYDLKQIKEQLKDIRSIQILELPVSMYVNQDVVSPLIVQNNRFFQPFEGVLKSRFDDTFDATAFISVVILLASALVFGDIGVGLIAMLIGTMITSSYSGSFGGVVQRLGLAIFCGGLLFGTVFYQNQVYPAVLQVHFGLLSGIGLWIGCFIVALSISRIIKKFTRKSMII